MEQYNEQDLARIARAKDELIRVAGEHLIPVFGDIDDQMIEHVAKAVEAAGFVFIDEIEKRYGNTSKPNFKCPKCGLEFHTRATTVSDVETIDCPGCSAHFDEEQVEIWSQTVWPDPKR